MLPAPPPHRQRLRQPARPQGAEKASANPQLCFYADWVNADRYLPPNAISNSVALALLEASQLRNTSADVNIAAVLSKLSTAYGRSGQDEEAAEYEEEYSEQEQDVEADDYAYSEYDDSTRDSYQDEESHYRIDEVESGSSNAFPDPEALKGLSKRERRRLRKQWRQQQRQADQ